MNRSHFQRQLTLIGTATNKELSPGLSDLWWRKYGALPDDVLAAAFEVVIDTCRFFPSPAEFNDILRQVAASRGAVVDGATAWEECERAIFRAWSEAGDALVRQQGGYPWPTPRCKQVLREQMGLTPRDVALMHPKEYAATRERFVALFDSGQAVAQAEAGALGQVAVLRLPAREVGD